MKLGIALTCVLLPVWMSGCDSDSGGSTSKKLKVQVVASSELGMQWIDADYSVFAFAPPYGVVRARVVRQGSAKLPEVLDDSKVYVRYSAVSLLGGAANSTSKAKTNFWDHADELFGVQLEPGEGLGGLYMPADAPKPGPQPMDFDAASGEWVARGLPITPIDDAGLTNEYPLLRITAYSKQTKKELAHLDVTVPVAFDTDCAACHATGGVAARDPASVPGPHIAWSHSADIQVQAKENILILHDARNDTQLYATKPVLCADCHYVAALDYLGEGPTGQQCYRATLSQVVHQTHGYAKDELGELVFPVDSNMEGTCYMCHPGHDARALRGAMHAARRECVDCHGALLSVGGVLRLLPGGSLDGKWDGMPRRPWVDLPRCQSCHTGDALSKLVDMDALWNEDGLRLKQAYRMRDDSASTFLAPNPRFAENEGKLFHDSVGHGGLACAACHGTPHGEWPNPILRTSDNVAAWELQKHGGVLIECTTCHPNDSLPLNVDGPHGLHNVGDPRFVLDHGAFYAADHQLCMACHGLELEGTVLSRAHTERSFVLGEGRVAHLAKGQSVSCGLCHVRPPDATWTPKREPKEPVQMGE